MSGVVRSFRKTNQKFLAALRFIVSQRLGKIMTFPFSNHRNPFPDPTMYSYIRFAQRQTLETKDPSRS
jgi:hypothetical protein